MQSDVNKKELLDGINRAVPFVHEGEKKPVKFNFENVSYDDFVNVFDESEGQKITTGYNGTCTIFGIEDNLCSFEIGFQGNHCYVEIVPFKDESNGALYMVYNNGTISDR